MNGWVNNGEIGGLRRHRTHYDVTVLSDPQADAQSPLLFVMAQTSTISIASWSSVMIYFKINDTENIPSVITGSNIGLHSAVRQAMVLPWYLENWHHMLRNNDERIQDFYPRNMVMNIPCITSSHACSGFNLLPGIIYPNSLQRQSRLLVTWYYEAFQCAFKGLRCNTYIMVVASTPGK